MATAERLTKNYLTCIICSEVYADPATLHCDHTFCRPCLLKYIKTQPAAMRAKSIPCPSCRQMTRVPSPDTPVEEWVNQMKPSRLIQGLVEDFGPGTDCRDLKLCHWCKHGGETTCATSWCPECEEYFCDKCLELHSRVPMTSRHEISTLSEDFIQKKKRPFMCNEHKDEKVKLFCKDCNKAICHTCCSINHRRCDKVVIMESILPDVRTKLGRKEKLLSKKVKDTQWKILKKKDEMGDILRRTSNAELEIKTTTQHVIDKIREKENRLLSDLEELKSRQVEEIKADIKSEEITVQTYQQQFEFIDQAIKSECQKDMFVMYESTDDTDKELEYRPLDRIKFTQDMDRLSKAVDDLHLGEVEVVKDVSDRKSAAVLHHTIDCKMEGDEKNPNLFDVLVLSVPGGKITVVADHDNSKIKAFYNLKSKVFKKTLTLSDGPWQLAYVQDSNVAVSFDGSKQIVIVRLDTDPVVISTITTENEYYGLACLTSSKLLGGTYEKKNSIDVIDLNGKIQTSMKTGAVRNPDYIHVTEKRNVIVSEEEAQSVVSVSSDGEVIFTYSHTGVRPLVNPWGITSTSTGDILLTDNVLNKVVQLSESGQFVRDVITEGLDSPGGLCLDDDGLLYVTSENCVKVYRFE